jgi:biopolymer transport protein ExbB
MMMESVIRGVEVSVQFLMKGGILMIPILLSSLIAVALIIERLWYYHRSKCNIPTLHAHMYPLVKSKRVEEAIGLCEQYRGVLPRIFKMVLQNHHRPVEEIERLVSVAGTHEIQKLSQYIRGLGFIGQMTPLMGFLGTVTGMIKTFMQIANLSGQVNPRILAGGIWEALITTAAGLIVAIPVVIMYHYFESVIEEFAFQMKNYSLELIELLKYDRV